MNLQQKIEAVCKLANDCKLKTDKSLWNLFQESGYQESSDEVTEELIEIYLDKNPSLTQSWLSHSEDNRGTPAWYFIFKNNKWIVGFYPGGIDMEFMESNKACAHYIKMLMRSLLEDS